jgi:hypothetical protein
VADPGELASGDHLCWAYHDAAEFQGQAHRFLADGLAAGQRVRYIGAGRPDELCDQLRDIEGVRGALPAGAVEIISLADGYAGTGVVDPAAQVRRYTEDVDSALRDGFTGLRVAVDATELVIGPGALDAFARYEHLVERHLGSRPFTALCAYHEPTLGADAIAELAVLHALDNTGAPFHLHGRPDSGSVALSGELDIAGRALFHAALERIDLPVRDGRLIVDAAGLTFVDHHALCALSGYAARRDAVLELRTDARYPARLLALLGVRNVRIEPVA